jgi:hypothetical protein
MLINNTEEFSLKVFNLDMSVNSHIPQWRGQKWSGNEKRITLIGENYINDFEVNLSVSITYQVVNSNVIKNF